ncbi:alpha/beta-hydrolase [Artomyces pyxidatus]|uniref:Alpha/beta-hydrolase n=1 Tax=Artomyces pyxidatus TaxID=48021 RepID=A0ACB8TAI8_9AGAM|nr:alpha/beta-hydrolase [Artomyces pyxidatus]
MPLATVRDGVAFYYEDSGPLEGPYTTLVMVHGTAFHADIFGPMLPFASANRVRIVLVNRRDYPGSTPFSTEELAALSSADLEVRADALSKQGVEIGLFLAWLVHTQGIPPVTADADGTSQGGLALVAWSLAHTPMAAFLAYADALPEDARATLEPCLRAYCIYDAPHTSFGLQTIDSYHPLLDTTYPPESRVPRFFSWVSAYYTHSAAALASHDPALLDTTPLPFPAPPAPRPPTLDAMTPADMARVAWPGPIEGSEGYIHGMPLAITWRQTERTLFDARLARVLPRCRVVVAWGGETLWESVGAAWALERIYRERKEAGDAVRPFDVVMMPGANHFPHWDEPEKMIQFLRSVI